MFSGESVWVKFWAEKNILDAVVDWFGKDFKILQKTSDKILINVKVNETAMKFWAMQYGEGVEIISPETLRFSIQQYPSLFNFSKISSGVSSTSTNSREYGLSPAI